MKRLSAFVVALLTCGLLGAQPAPFDMTGERPIEDQAPAPNNRSNLRGTVRLTALKVKKSNLHR